MNFSFSLSKDLDEYLYNACGILRANTYRSFLRKFKRKRLNRRPYHKPTICICIDLYNVC